MNNFSNLTLTIKIDKPVDEVWRSLVDWKGQSKWMLQTKVWSELDQDRTVKNGKGVLIFAFTGIFPKLYPKLKLGILDTMEVTNWKPPHICEVMHIGRVIRGTGKFELKKVRGVADEGILKELGQPTLNIQIDRERAARYGIASSIGGNHAAAASACR